MLPPHLSASFRAQAQRALARGWFLASALVIAFLGLLFLLFALYLALAPRWGNAVAALIAGGLACLIAAAFAFAGLRRRRVMPAPYPAVPPEEIALTQGMAAADLARGQLRRAPVQTLALCLGAGAILGANPQLIGTLLGRRPVRPAPRRSAYPRR